MVQPGFLKPRRPTRRLTIGGVAIGGGAPVSVQSMTTTPTLDVAATLAQIGRLADAGCDLVRVTVPDPAAAAALADLVRAAPLPIIADIHFDHTLALAALAAGVAGLRLNPGNIGGRERVREVARAARERNVPIRIGVNGGSLEPGLRQRVAAALPVDRDAALAAALVESALRQAGWLEAEGVTAIKISLKASSVPATVMAYRLIAPRCDYPLHLGVTEAGTVLSGSIKSALGIGILLAEGIGDTIRVSLAGPPEAEIPVARRILADLGLRHDLPEVVACPTCGRTTLEVAALALQLEAHLARARGPLKVAVMGCAVNGPGEARDADYAICGAGAGEVGLLFAGGKMAGQAPVAELLDRLLDRLRADGRLS